MENRALKRFFLVYISFFTCLTLLIVPFYSLALSLYTKNSLKTNEEMLRRGLLSLENEFNSIYTAGLAIFSDPSLMMLGNSKLPLTSRRIYMLKRSSQLVSDTFLYLGDQINAGLILQNGIILTSSGSCYTAPEQLYGRVLSYKGYDSYEDWFSYLTDFSGNYTYKGSATVISGDKIYDAITYVQRLPINTKGNKYILYAMLNKDYITKVLLLPDIMASSSLHLTDSNNNVLLHIEGNQTQEYTTINCTSNEYGLKATVGIDKALFEQGLKPLRTLVLAFSASYILVGIILSMVYSWKSFKPLNSLMRSTTGLSLAHNLNDRLPDQFKTDYDYIQHFLAQTGTAFKAYEAKFEQQRELLRSYMLGRMLNGQVYSDRTYQTAKEYFPNFPPQYRVVGFRMRLKAQLNLLDFSKQQILWQSVVSEFLPEGAIQHIMNNLLVLIWPYCEDNAMNQIKEQLTKIQDTLQSVAQTACNAAASTCFSGIENLSTAHRQTLNLLRVMTDTNSSHLLFGDHLNQNRNQVYNVMDSIDPNRFYELLRRAQAQSAKDMVNKSLTVIEQTPGCDDEYIRSIFYTYHYGLLYVYNEFECEYSSEILQVTYNPQISIQVLFEKLLNCIDLVCINILEQQQVTSDELGKNIIQYIQNNYANPDMYVRLVIDKFGISEHALQKYMRDLTGKSFFEYLENLRMEYAWKLVSENKLPLGEIILKCGYTSYNSFYKAFKRNFGMSPSASVMPSISKDI